MSNSYWRIWNSGEILETSEESARRDIDFSVVYDDIFKGRNITYRYLCQSRSYKILSISYNGMKYNVYLNKVTNSGINTEKYMYDKRIQVYAKIPVKLEGNVFVLGYYNVGNKRIYVCSDAEFTDVYNNAIQGGSYSSFWIKYDGLKECNEKGCSSWRDGEGRYLSAMTSEYISNLTDEELIGRFFTVNAVSEPEVFDLGDDDAKLVLYENTVYHKTGVLMPRNPMLKRKAFQREHYTCEICHTRHTFISGKTNEEFFEGHHLIMYNQSVQSRYRYSLDNVENIICLCPTCHRRIHNASATEKEKFVRELLEKHNKLKEIYDIKDERDIQMIVDDYINNVKDEGDESDER